METLSKVSVADQIRSEFPFSVDRLPLTGPKVTLGRGDDLPPVTKRLETPHCGLFRNDSGACVGVAVKAGYVPHTVSDIVALAQAAAGSFEGVDGLGVSCKWHNDAHYVTVSPSNEYRRTIFGTADAIFPRMIVRAGYDGRSFLGSLGFYRDLCRNLAMLQSDGRQCVAKIRHTTDLPNKMADLQRTFRTLAESWPGMVETARRLESTQVDLAGFLRDVYPMAADATDRTRRSHERRIEKIVERIVRERRQTGRPDPTNIRQATAWEAFNGVQGFVQHDQHRRGRLDDMARSLLALDDSAVARASALALAV